MGGAVSDRLSRRAILLWADMSGPPSWPWARWRSLSPSVPPGSTSYAWPELVIGTATAFSSPAFDAMVPQLVPEGELTQANAIEQFMRPSAVQLAGPALGGIAVALVHPSGVAWPWTLPPSRFRPCACCGWRPRVARCRGRAPRRRQLGARGPRGLAVRAGPGVVVGDIRVGHLHLSVVHRPHPGAPAVRGAQFPPPGGVDLRDDPRRRRVGGADRGSGLGPPQPPAKGHAVDLRVLDAGHPGRGRLRPGYQRPRAWPAPPWW